MSSIPLHSYRTALQQTVATYAAAVQPSAAPLPTDHSCINLRSDRKLGDVGIGLPAILQHVSGQWDCRQDLRPGRRYPIAVPSSSTVHCDVAAKAQVRMRMRLAGGKPSGTLLFTPPLHLRDPVPGMLGKIPNFFINYDLDKLILAENNAVTVEGHICFGRHRLRLPYRRQVVAPTDAAAQNHSLVGIWLATSVAFLRAIPANTFKTAGKALHGSMAQSNQADYVDLLESVFPILGRGELRGRATVSAQRPVVVRTDVADVLFAAQTLQQSTFAHLDAHAGGIRINIARGSRIDAPATRIDLDGNILLDGRSVRGEQMQLAVKSLQGSVFFNNGTANAMLVPLHIDGASCADDVALAEGAFSFGESYDLRGKLQFCVPARLDDCARTVRTEAFSLQLGHLGMGVLLRGQLAHQAAASSPAVQGPSKQVSGTAAHTQLSVMCDLRDVDVRGRFVTHDAVSAWGCRGDAPLHIAARSDSRPPVAITMHYDDGPGIAAANTFGASLRFALPVRVPAPAVLSLHAAPGAIKLDSTELSTSGHIRMGRCTRSADVDVEGRASLQLGDVHGLLTVHRQALSGLTVEAPATLALCGRRAAAQRQPANLAQVRNHLGQPQAVLPPQARLHMRLRRLRGEASVGIEGGGSFRLPAQLPPHVALRMGLPGGNLRLGNTHALLRSDDVRFALKGGHCHLQATVCTDASTLADCHYLARVGLSERGTTLEPVLASDDDDDDASYVTASEELPADPDAERDAQPEARPEASLPPVPQLPKVSTAAAAAR